MGLGRHLRAWLLATTFLSFASSSVPAAEAVRFRRGDASADGHINVVDPVRTLLYLFAGLDAPTCLDAADTNDDGRIEIADAVGTLGFLFLGAAEPPAPFAACGEDPTPDGLGCLGFSPCLVSPVHVNIQVDAELDDIDGLANMADELQTRGIAATIYVSADYANRNATRISNLFQRGFEIALHGFYTGEQLESMTYEEQKDLLTRAKKALEGCKPCGTYKPIVGFRPQYFSQNEDTFRVLEELGFTYDSGFKVGELYGAGHEWDAKPYPIAGHALRALPITTIPHADERTYLCDISCAQVLEMSAAEWKQALSTGLAASLESREPLVVLLHGWYTGDDVRYDYWQPFLDFLDEAQGKVVFVNSKELVDLTQD